MGQAVHIGGIGGIGMSGVALLLHECDIEVRGTDMRRSAITDLLQERGISISYSPKPQWSAEASWVCVPRGFPEMHVERLAAIQANKFVITRNQAMSLILSEHSIETVAVVGTLGRAYCARAIAIGASGERRWGWCVGAVSRDEYLHAHLGDYMVVEFDERDDLEESLPYNATALVVSDWQSDSMSYYSVNDMLERIIEVSIRRRIPCIYPVSVTDRRVVFCAMMGFERIQIGFDIRLLRGKVEIGLSAPFPSRSIEIWGGITEASAMCAALVYLVFQRYPASIVYELIEENLSHLKFVGWYEREGNLIHDIRMHPVSIRQSLLNIHHSYALEPALVLKPYAMTLRAYPWSIWSEILNRVHACYLLPPYEGASGEELELLAEAFVSSGKPVSITTSHDAWHQMANDPDRPWLWVGAPDILPSASSLLCEPEKTGIFHRNPPFFPIGMV